MNPFQVRSHLTGYTPAVIRLLIGIGMLLPALFYRKFLILPSEPLNRLLGGILLLGLLGPTQIHLAIAEIALVCEHRRQPARRDMPFAKAYSPQIKPFSVEEIVDLLERSALADFGILSNGHIVRMGVFSDRRILPVSDGKPINKCFYLDGNEFPSIEAFLIALPPYTRNGQIAVQYIDRILLQRDALFR